MAVPALVRAGGQVLLALQKTTATADPSAAAYARGSHRSTWAPIRIVTTARPYPWRGGLTALHS
jgi:hypothetical protein